jgi:class 3 adenylate cyclase
MEHGSSLAAPLTPPVAPFGSSKECRNKHVPTDQRIEIRVGIHVGDIITQYADFYGAGVNIAARLRAVQ